LGKISDELFDYSIIKQLYWNEQIRQYEKSIEFDEISDFKFHEEQIIKISVENSIMNKYTSFVLVDKTGEFDVEQIGKDLVVPNLSSSNTGFVKPMGIPSHINSLGQQYEYLESLDQQCGSLDQQCGYLNFQTKCPTRSSHNISKGISSIIGSMKNACNSIRGAIPVPKCSSVRSDSSESCSFSSPYTLPSVQVQPMSGSCESVDCLEGGMDMFGGGGGGGYYEQKYKTSIDWNTINKFKNPANGSYKFESGGWKCLCYISQADFDAHCTQVNMIQVLFFNIIILLELEKILSPEYHKLKKYFEEKYPGLYDSKKVIISQLYDAYIDNLKTQKVWVSSGGGDY